MVGMPDTPAAVRSRPLVIGHRGASGLRPEHTESAYRLACRQGVDAVEPDVVVTRDGVLVVRHENEISGTTDVADHPEFADRRTTKTVDGVELTGWFTEDFDWAELAMLRSRERLPEVRPDNREFDGREPILRLSDVLAIIDEESAALDRGIGVVLEVKHAQYFSALGHRFEELLPPVLTESGWADRRERLVIECFELGILERLRAEGLAADFVFLLEHAGAGADEVAREAAGGPAAASYAWYRSDAGLDALTGRVAGISVDTCDLVRVGPDGAAEASDLVQRAHARGLTVFTWTLRPENRFLATPFRTGEASDPGAARAWGDWRAAFGAIVRTGVDGIFVDHPELGAEAARLS